MGGDPSSAAGAPPGGERQNKLLPMSPYETEDQLATRMIISDAKLHQCRRCVIFEPPPPGSALILGDPSCVPANAATANLDQSVPTLMDYAVTRPNNILVPPYTPPSDDEKAKAEKKKEEEGVKFTGPSTEAKASRWTDETSSEFSQTRTTYDDGAVLDEVTRTRKREIAPARSMTEQTTTTSVLNHPREGVTIQETEVTTQGPNEDFRDKFPKREDMELVIAKVEAEAKAEGAVADGKFGEDGDFFSGTGSLLGGEAVAKATGQVSNKGLKGEGEASLGGHLVKGTLQTDDSRIAHAKGSATLGKADASAKGSVEISAEKFTLEGGLSAALLLGELEGEGTIEITPKRIGNSFIDTWNWVTDDDVATLGDEHDWGLKVTLGASAAVGAQAEVKGDAHASASKAGVSGKAKLAVGAGVGVKAGAEIVGIDKVLGSLKTAGRYTRDAVVSGATRVGNAAATGWGKIKSGWNSLWE